MYVTTLANMYAFYVAIIIMYVCMPNSQPYYIYV